MEIISYDRLPQEAKHIREEVFVKEQGFKYEFDDKDGVSVHLVAFDCGKPVATCRFYRRKGSRDYVLGRIAVLKENRGAHIGALMIAEAEKMLPYDAECVLIHAQLQAQGFYEKQGYMAYGATDNEENCPHIWMRKYLRR